MAQTLTVKYFGLPNPVKDFLTTIGFSWTSPNAMDGGYAKAFWNNDKGQSFQNWDANTASTPDGATTAGTIATDGLGTYSVFQFVIHDSQKEQFENVISNFVFYLDNEKCTLSKDSYVKNSSWARYTIKTGLANLYWENDHEIIIGYSSGITVTPTLTNCTIYPTETSFDSGSEVTFTVRANEGYKFTTAPTIGSTAMTKVTNTVYTSTVTLTSDTTITASARKPSRLYATNKMVSADFSPKNSWYTNGQKVNFTASGSDYTQFTIPPTINGIPMDWYQTYATYNNWVMTDDVVFEGKADYEEITYYTATVSKNNCSIYPQATQFYDGQEITVTVWADDGFSFYDVPTVDGTEMTKLSNTAYTYTFTPTKDFEIVANASKPKVYHNATYNLSNCSISPNDAQLVEGQEYTFTATANENYEFTTVPTLNGNAFTKVSDSVYQITFTITGDITVNASATEIPIYSIIYNITHCSGTPTGQFYKGTQLTITLTADSGYGFTNEVPTINGADMTKVAENQYTYTGTITQNWTVTGIAYYIPKTFTVTANLTNCTIAPTTTQFREGSTETFIVTANDGYTFKVAPTSTLGDIVKVNDAQYSIGIEFTENVTITASAEELPHATFTFGTLTNCTCNYKSGDNLDANKAIVFTANDGYYFDNYTLSWVSSTGLVLHSTLNGTVATLLDADTVKSYVDSRESISIGDVTAIISLVDVVNGVNVYTITNEELTDLMNVRFVAEQTDSANDFGKYIANLYIAPFNIEDIKGSETTIVLGYRNSNVGATRLIQTYIDISLGNITIPNYENAYETNANYRLYLPFIREIVNLPTEFIVGHTITIKYHIDFIEESITVTITNEVLEMPFTYNKYSFGRNLPFFNTEYGSTNLQYDNEQVENTMTAYVIKTVNEAYNDNTEIGKNTYIYDSISNYEGGYIECTNAKVEDSKITKQESDELSTLLRNGVYINAVS